MKRFQRLLFLLGISIALALLVASGLVLTESPVSAQRSVKAKRQDGSYTTSAISDSASPTAALTPGNLVIYRVGDGSGALSSAAAAVFLDEYTPGGVLVQSIALPTAVNGANRRLTSAGSSTSEGLVTRSADGNFLVFAGYDAAVGTAAVAGTTSAATNRVIGRVGANGIVDTTTALTDAATGGNPRGAASSNGTDLWFSGSAGGVRYATFGSTTSTQLATTPTNIRGVGLAGGQLFVSTQSGAFRLASVGTGSPTTSGQTITNLPGLPTATGSPYGFYFADLSSGVAGLDTLYYADDTAPAGIYKYSLVGGTWVANGSVALTAARGLTATTNGASVSMFITNGTSFQSLTDSTGYNVTIAGTPSSLATAATNTAFRGIAFTPGSTGTTQKARVDLNGDGRTDYVIARPLGAFAGASAAITSRFRGSARERLRNRAAALAENAVGGGTPIQWWGLNSNDFAVFTAEWGDFVSDDPLTADFDGDGKDDIAVWRPLADGSFIYSLNSSDFTVRQVNFGGPLDDPSVIGDYDGDGADDPAVFRCPQDAPGTCHFYYRPSSIPNSGDWAVAWGFGQGFDAIPYPGDFNGDGKIDFAVQQASPTNPGNGIFYIALNGTFEFSSAEWGSLSDRLVPGDFDGDGKSDITVTRIDDNDVLNWYVLERDGGMQFVKWGNGLDYQAPGDYDGDGRVDFAIYRENTTDATFWVLPSNGNTFFAVTWGQPGDFPLAYRGVQ